MIQFISTLSAIKHSVKRYLPFLLLPAFFLVTESAKAIVIRADMKDSDYQNYASEFSYVGGLVVGNDVDDVRNCSGSLIHPQWVMTAAHCLYKNGNEIIYGNFFIRGHMFRVIGGVAFKEWKYPTIMKFFSPHADIALLLLEGDGVPANITKPVQLDAPDLIENDGKTGALVGFGRTGDGLKGITKNDERAIKRAGTNKMNIGDIANIIFESSIITTNRLYSFDFDHERKTNLSNTDSNENPQMQEAMIASGDSGGAIVQGGPVVPNIFGPDPVLTGIISHSWLPIACALANKEMGQYCTVGYAVRTRFYAGWSKELIEKFKHDAPPIKLQVPVPVRHEKLFDDKKRFIEVAPGKPPIELLNGTSSASFAEGDFSVKFKLTSDTFGEEFNRAEYDKLFIPKNHPKLFKYQQPVVQGIVQN